jgi:hypothetical protein
MEKSRRRLKSAAIIVLMFTVSELVELVAQFFLIDFSAVQSSGLPSDIILIAELVALAIMVLTMIPSLYVGIKGIKVANDPDYSTSHIVWAVIILIFAFLELAAVIFNIVVEGNIFDNFGYLLLALIDIVIYIDYIKWAKVVDDEY